MKGTALAVPFSFILVVATGMGQATETFILTVGWKEHTVSNVNFHPVASPPINGNSVAINAD